MAIRFRKSIKIAPGIRLNVSKGGVSTSIGGRGATVNISKKGTRVTAGIPGSGLSASHLFKSANRQGKPVTAREYSSTEWAVSLAIVALFAAFIAYKASGAFSFFAGAVATAIPAYFILRWLSKRKRVSNPAEYWAGKSREIQKAHEALPDAAKGTPSEPQDRALGGDTPQNIYSVTIPESATHSVLDALKAESENRKDYLGPAANVARAARDAMKAGKLDKAWSLQQDQKHLYLQHANQCGMTAREAIALSTSVHQSMANVLRLEGRHQEALAHILYWRAGSADRSTKIQDQKVRAYFNRCRLKKTTLEDVQALIDLQSNMPSLPEIQGQVRDWVARG
ncbi:DUF4236 domain-containing protein [Pseudomonas monteilii]|uniref:DUF4236 domain-containing protein n=1 Tax=Pseudomonas monteilii TaxID=76759 RepID=UPI0018A6212B|nr:DUF4236 domain-containing protein [Pseudomonas monteilii]BBV97900.1 hypothetical protein STW0522PSE72_32510 [Pseudomonas monteilii]